MKHFSIADLHAHLRNRRHTLLHLDDTLSTTPAEDYTKKYPRMEKIAPAIHPLPATLLQDAISARKSARAFEAGTIMAGVVAGLFQHSCGNLSARRRPYPSGGSRYVVEVYMLAFDVTGLERSSYHYRPDQNEFEKLFEIPEGVGIATFTREPAAQQASTLIILSAYWPRSTARYSEFAMELALMESGHIAQNMLLCAAAYDVAARPLCNFDDAALQDHFDMDFYSEQVLYAIALGSHPKKT